MTSVGPVLADAARAAVRNATWPRRLTVTLVGIACAYILLFVVIALMRLTYPYQLEWMEGLTLEHVQQIRSGLPLYAPPSLQFVPLNYTPLYFYVAAVVSTWIEGFAAVRLLSLVCSLGSFALLFAFVRRETGSAIAGLLSAGLYAATYRLSGAWFDVGRVDSMFMVLLLAAFYLLRDAHERHRTAIAGAAFLALAFLAKQSAIVAALPVLMFLLFESRHRFMSVAATLAVILGGTTALMQFVTDGWYGFYIWGVASGHEIVPARAASFWVADLNAALLIGLLFGLLYFMSHRGAAASRYYLLAMTLGMVASSGLHRLYTGSYDNVLMTAYAGLAVLFGMGWHEAQALARRAPPRLARRLAYFLPVVGLVQFSLLAYDPAQQLPSAADRVGGDRVMQVIRAVDGDVLAPAHGYLVRRAGKTPHFHVVAFMDVVNSDRSGVGEALMTEFREAVSRQDYAGVLLETRDWLRDEVEPGYEIRYEVFNDPRAFWTMTGLKTRPDFVAVPRDSLIRGAG